MTFSCKLPKLTYWTEGELLGYQAALKKERDYKAVMDQKFDDGLAQGKNQIVIEMLKDGEPDAKILKYSKITPEELEDLKRQLNTAGDDVLR